MPRLFTRISTSGWRCGEFFRRGRVLRSPAKPETSPPVVAFSFATRLSTADCVRPLTITRAPSRPSAAAMARPMPAVLPLTSASLPFSPRSMGDSLSIASSYSFTAFAIASCSAASAPKNAGSCPCRRARHRRARRRRRTAPRTCGPRSPSACRRRRARRACRRSSIAIISPDAVEIPVELHQPVGRRLHLLHQPVPGCAIGASAGSTSNRKVCSAAPGGAGENEGEEEAKRMASRVEWRQVGRDDGSRALCASRKA